MNTVATLGPAGTDAETMARQITQDVILCDSFTAAMDYAIAHDVQALIACGYKEVVKEKVVDTWVDLNFRFFEKARIVNTYYRNTKPMCIAIRQDCKNRATL
jgi:ABC-type iron transport system FetAB ATPase subunit